MKNIFLLVLAMLKGNGLADLGGDRDNKSINKNGKIKKKLFNNKSSIIMLTFAGLYLGGISVLYVSSGYDFLKPIGLESLILGIAVSMIAFLSFFFGLFYVMSVFYFSSDIDKLLPLPVTPGQLLLSKFIVTLAYEYLVILVALTPAMITYGVLNSNGFLYYLYMIITVLFLPIIPLVIASIVIMIIMRFSKSARNKDRFTLVASLIAILGGVALSFGMQKVLANVESVDFANILSQSIGKMTQIASNAFPGTFFVNYAMAKPYGWDSAGMMLLFILLTVVFVLALYLLGNLLYFKGVIGISASSSKRRILTKEEFNDSTGTGNVFLTYMKKDLKVLFRTPIFFMNNVLSIFIMPFLIIFPLFFSDSSDGFSLAAIKEIVNKSMFEGEMKLASYMLVGLFGFIAFVCGTNGITESAISREGNCAYFMKIIPMSYKMQIWAKIMVGVFLSLIGAILITIVFLVIIMPPWWFALLCLLVFPGAILFPNITGIIFDLYMPKIKWDNEQKAVKQNMNVLYGILLSTIFVGIMVGIVYLVSFSFALVVALLVVVPLLLTAISTIIVNQVINKTMKQLMP